MHLETFKIECIFIHDANTLDLCAQNFPLIVPY